MVGAVYEGWVYEELAAKEEREEKSNKKKVIRKSKRVRAEGTIPYSVVYFSQKVKEVRLWFIEYQSVRTRRDYLVVDYNDVRDRGLQME